MGYASGHRILGHLRDCRYCILNFSDMIDYVQAWIEPGRCVITNGATMGDVQKKAKSQGQEDIEKFCELIE